MSTVYRFLQIGSDTLLLDTLAQAAEDANTRIF